MSEHEATARASFSKRAAARAIDAFLTLCLAALLTIGATFAATLVAQPGIITDENWGSFYGLFGLLMAAASILVIRYEVSATSRRGGTVGKRSMDIRVVRCGDQHGSLEDWEHPDPVRSLVRWAVPHGAGVFAALVAGVVAVPRIGGFGVLVGAGSGLAAWAIVYLSALLDSTGQGWHDKAAGTVVVEASCLPPKPTPAQDPQPRQPASPEPARPAPEDSQQTYGLVSDYYAPRRSPSPSPEEDDPQAGEGNMDEDM